MSQKASPLLSDEQAAPRLADIRQRVAQPFVRGLADPQPASLRGGVLIGSQYHAANVANLVRLGVTAVLNCASGGISRLPVDQLQEQGIRYQFTNVRQDDYEYPILHDAQGNASAHLQVARQLYEQEVVGAAAKGGKILFFCVAGMNRSTCLGIATLLLFGYSLDDCLDQCQQQRPFVLENQGFQRQLVQLEALLRHCKRQKVDPQGNYLVYEHGAPPKPTLRTESSLARDARLVEIELLIPGLCTMDVQIPMTSTIETVKQCLVDHANRHLLSYDDDEVGSSSSSLRVAKSWLVLAMFGYDSMYDLPLELEAIELRVQLERMKSMFHLKIQKTPQGTHVVRWNEKCRFALVIFSVYPQQPQPSLPDGSYLQQPWTFLHEERPRAPATFLENNLLTTNLRAWDFVTGQAYASEQPIVFSYSNDDRDRRSFMKISTSANRAQQFHAPGEGGILGMGANAIVHRVKLKPTSLESPTKGNPVAAGGGGVIGEEDGEEEEELSGQEGWDAAVKRPFSLSKMLASLENSSEAGLAKRMRIANSLNSDGRVLYFYGLGVAMSANVANHPDDDDEAEETSAGVLMTSSGSKYEYKWEAILLARYEEEFASYTLKRFMDDYIAVVDRVRLEDPTKADEIDKLQKSFSLISVKILLVSLLNAFRDLTLMGVQAFDFNHLNNVLISRDHSQVRLIDIDGNSKGSIQFPSTYIQGEATTTTTTTTTSKTSPTKQLRQSESKIHKPSLDVDLNAVLPTTIQQLLLGKGRGVAFVTNTKSEIWKAPPEEALAMIRTLLLENFYPNSGGNEDEVDKIEKHVTKVAIWFYAVLKKQSPWFNWTKDIYDAMRCIDHLPIT